MAGILVEHRGRSGRACPDGTPNGAGRGRSPRLEEEQSHALAIMALLALAGLSAAACSTGLPGPTANTTGLWRGTYAFRDSWNAESNLKQDGAKITGDLRLPGSPVTRPIPITGTVYGNDVRFDGPNVTGWATVQGDQMTGRVYGVFPETDRLSGVPGAAKGPEPACWPPLVDLKLTRAAR